MPRRNRVDPWADLHAVAARGMFTGNRGCIVDGHERVVRHHATRLWIACVTSFGDRRYPLARPNRWTPIFFLDDAVALAAGHRPCGFCRRADHHTYRDAVTAGVGAPGPLLASELDRRLAGERLRRGRGLDRASDRRLWSAAVRSLPSGTVVVPTGGHPHLLLDHELRPFTFVGWGAPAPRPPSGKITVLTPPTSVLALANGFTPVLHASAGAD
ncbi:MAG: hypothetical protein H0W46_05765 [Acidimicrobiia bacterium]|nr:hypothetical protein [Acidimicrobiia bacterium]